MQMLLQFQKSRSSFPYLFRIHLQLIQALRQLAAGKRPLPPTINHLASVRDYRFHNAARRLPKKTPMCPSTQRASRASKKFFFSSCPAEIEQSILGLIVLAPPFPRSSATIRQVPPIICSPGHLGFSSSSSSGPYEDQEVDNSRGSLLRDGGSDGTVARDGGT